MVALNTSHICSPLTSPEAIPASKHLKGRSKGAPGTSHTFDIMSAVMSGMGAEVSGNNVSDLTFLMHLSSVSIVISLDPSVETDLIHS